MQEPPDGPLIWDLCCCEGGAGMGYRRAGFGVVGFDIVDQPRYPFPFFRMDVYDALLGLALGGLAGLPDWLFRVVAVHISPPRQRYSRTQKIQGNDHPDMVARVRDILDWVGLPYVIENVPGAPLRDPVTLCGAAFGLRTYRHRLFESNIPLTAPKHPEHVAPITKMGRAPRDGEFMHVVGNFSGVAQAREAMGIDWMTRDGLRESIPPAYTEHLGRQLLAHIRGEAADEAA